MSHYRNCAPGPEARPSANRSVELYQRLQRTAEPITVPALRLSTDRAADDVLAAAVGYLTESVPERRE